MSQEQVVLLGDDDKPVGTQSKETVHHTDTPYHLAFSCYLLNGSGEMLLTRRAITKVAWPGIWSNSVCGHPQPGEALRLAVARRVEHELGMGIETPELLHPTFRYRATDCSGIVENEFCPVFVARTLDSPKPQPDEVMDYYWIALPALFTSIDNAPFLFSPWMVEQLATTQVRQGLLEAVRRGECISEPSI